MSTLNPSKVRNAAKGSISLKGTKQSGKLQGIKLQDETLQSGKSQDGKHLSYLDKAKLKMAREAYENELRVIELEKSGKIEQASGKRVMPEEPGFDRFESMKTLLRRWQKNPKEGDDCWIINGRGQIERVPVNAKFRLFFENYRLFNTFLSEEDARDARDRLLEFMEGLQYEKYGLTKQLDLFEDQMRIVEG